MFHFLFLILRVLLVDLEEVKSNIYNAHSVFVDYFPEDFQHRNS